LPTTCPWPLLLPAGSRDGKETASKVPILPIFDHLFNKIKQIETL
jgi:hypothetical protein